MDLRTRKSRVVLSAGEVVKQPVKHGTWPETEPLLFVVRQSLAAAREARAEQAWSPCASALQQCLNNLLQIIEVEKKKRSEERRAARAEKRTGGGVERLAMPRLDVVAAWVATLTETLPNAKTVAEGGDMRPETIEERAARVKALRQDVIQHQFALAGENIIEPEDY